MEFKKWLNEISDPESGLESIHVYKDERDGAYKHIFDIDNIVYTVEVKPTTMEPWFKKIIPFARFLKPEQQLTGYAINLIGKGMSTQLTGLAKEYASRIYSHMLKTIAKVQKLPDAPPMEFITYWPQHPKMSVIYDLFRKKYFKNYEIVGKDLLVRKDVVDKLEHNPEEIKQHIDQEKQIHDEKIQNIKTSNI